MLGSRVFVCTALALASLYYFTAGIQYWISDYLQVVLKVPADEVYYFFAFTCLTAPFMGVILGGIGFSAIGGYNSPKSFRCLLYLALIGLFFALPIPFSSVKLTVYSLIFAVFFIGALMLPTLTGVMLNSVDERYRTTANSVATLGYNLFGFLPAPCIYGYVSTLGKNEMMASRWAMGCLTWATLFTVLFLTIGYRKQ